MRALKITLLVCALGLLGMVFAGASAAQSLGPAAAGDPAVTVDVILQAMQSGKWLFVFGAALVMVVKLAGWGLAALSARFTSLVWFQTTTGKKALAFGTAFLMAVGTPLMSGQGFSVSLLGTALSLAWVAAGQNEHLKDAAKKPDPAAPAA